MAMKKTKWPKAAVGVPIPIYGGTVWVVKKPQHYQEMLRSLGQDEQDDLPCAGVMQRFGDKATQSTVYLVGVFDGAPGTLAHEVTHVAFNIFERVGAKVEDGHCNEAFCYLVGWLVWKITEAL
jgi:hypothetical protein